MSLPNDALQRFLDDMIKAYGREKLKQAIFSDHDSAAANALFFHQASMSQYVAQEVGVQDIRHKAQQLHASGFVGSDPRKLGNAFEVSPH
jgi:hypothetical protein